MSFLRKIGKNAWAYALYAAVVVLVYGWAFRYLAQTPREAKLILFLASYSKSYDGEETLEAAKPEGIEELEIHAYPVNHSSYWQVFNTYGLEISDLLVLPESEVSEELCSEYFSSIALDVFQDIPNLGRYSFDGSVYGVKVHDKATGESLLPGLDYGSGEKEEDSYLFFHEDSPHNGGLDGKSEEGASLRFAREALSA